jgi:hypothetical protein
MVESAYQAKLIRKITQMIPGVACFKQDAMMYQGIPDLLILCGSRWAMLEVKISASAPIQPNQQYWVEHYNDMSYAAIIYPENEEEVLRGLQLAFGYLG